MSMDVTAEDSPSPCFALRLPLAPPAACLRKGAPATSVSTRFSKSGRLLPNAYSGSCRCGVVADC